MRTFEIENIKTGQRKDLFCNQIDLRTLIPPGWKLAEVPSRIAVCPTGGPSQGDSALKGFYALEQQHGTAQTMRMTGMKELGLRSPSDVKKVWRDDK